MDLSLVQEGFLLDHEPCGRLRSSLELVIGSIRLARSNRFIKLPCVALDFALYLNSCNTLLPNLDQLVSALSLGDSCVVLSTLQFIIRGSSAFNSQI
jgi:hypothetical protein